MKMIKRIMSGVALTATLLSSVACGNTGTGNEGTPATTSKDKVKLQWYINFSWFPTKWGEDPVSQKITELTGVDIEYIVPAGNEAEKLSTMIASDTLPDLLTLGWWEGLFNDMISGDMLQPLNKLAETYKSDFTKVAVPERLNWYTRDDGNVYGYPNASFSPSDYKNMKTIESNQTFLVRKDIYEAIGSPNMSTPEGFLDALSKAKEKFPTVDGQALIPFGLHEFTDQGNFSLETFLMNYLAIPFEKDGKIYDRFTDPEYIAWLKTLRKANEMGLIAKDIFVDKRAQMEEKIAQKRYFAMLYQWTDCQAQLKTLYTADPNQTYIAVDGPKNSKQDPHTINGPGIAGWTLTSISKKSKYPDKALELMTFMMGEEGQKLIWAGIEGQTYDVVNDKIVFKPEVLDLVNKDRAAYDKKYGGSTTHWMLMDNAFANAKGYTTPDEEPGLSIKKWTTSYAQNNSAYEYLPFVAETPEAKAGLKIDAEKGKVIPQLILAKSDEEFDKMYSDFLKFRQENGIDLILAEQQKQMDANKKRLNK